MVVPQLSSSHARTHSSLLTNSLKKQYDDDFDDYEDDDFEDDEPTPQKRPPAALSSSSAANKEDDIARMIREENEKAMKESKFVTNFSSPTSGVGGDANRNKNNNENYEPAPIKSGLDREHLVNAYGDVARGMKLPERKVKGLPVKGSRAVTDAQIEAAKARVARWKMVNAAVGGMNYQDAACGTDNLLTNEPSTSRELFERGVGPYANCQMATTVRLGCWCVIFSTFVKESVFLGGFFFWIFFSPPPPLLNRTPTPPQPRDQIRRLQINHRTHSHTAPCVSFSPPPSPRPYSARSIYIMLFQCQKCFGSSRTLRRANRRGRR